MRRLLLCCYSLFNVQGLLTGTIAPGVRLLHGTCSTGYAYFKQKELVYLSNDFDESIVNEVHVARLWCREKTLDNTCGVSFLQEESQKGQFSYMMLYREGVSLPKIVTIEGMIRNPELALSELSSLQVFQLLQRHCKHQNTFLQMNDLKMWNNGSAFKRMRFESSLGLDHSTKQDDKDDHPDSFTPFLD
jgi:hypothetical protein